MISARAFRLIRVGGLRAAHRAIAALACSGTPLDVRARAVIVPTRGAAWQFRRTLERLWLSAEWRPSADDRARLGLDVSASSDALALPDLLTRGEWYRRHLVAARGRATWLSEPEREVMLRAACEDAIAAGTAPPFPVRPGLVAEILVFYDSLRRQQRTVGDFERLLVGALEPSAESDRGARRMLQQTRFLVAALRAYESRLDDAAALDEHRCREHLAAGGVPSPYRHLVVTVADQAAEPFGLWRGDFDLLTRLPRLERVDVVATEAALASGFHERLLDHLPGIEECRPSDLDEPPPILVAPPREEQRLFFLGRDREDEVAETIRRLRARQATTDTADARDTSPFAAIPFEEIALVYQRPLPYLYVGRQLLDSAGMPYQAADTLPLAAEPYAATLDVVCEFVLTRQTRTATLALLRSPHLRIDAGNGRPDAAAVCDLDGVWRERGEGLGRERLAELADELSSLAHADSSFSGAAHAARAARDAADALAPLTVEAPASVHLETLAAFLVAHDWAPPPGAHWAERDRRARAAVRTVLSDLCAAHREHDDRVGAFRDVVAELRRWVEAHTFAPRLGDAGLHLADEQAARYGDFAAVHLLGMVEGDWPGATTRNVFYPSSLLRDLGWPREGDRLPAARAAFVDLLRLAGRETSVSAFLLEDDALVRVSPLLEDLDQAALAVARLDRPPTASVFPHEALSDPALDPDVLPAESATWLRLRRSRSAASAPQFHGAAGETRQSSHSVTSIETYLDCPFRYFAGRLLRLEEERSEETALDARRRGRFVHAVFERFFQEWAAAGRGAMTPASIDAAHGEFRRVAEPMLDELPETDRLVERLRLFGSAVAPGLAERVFQLEAERGAAVLERRLEFDIAGEYTLEAGRPERRLALRGVADRIDLLADGTLRVLDYKTGGAPDRRRAVQLPVYGACAERRLEGYLGRRWRVGEAAYIAFGSARPYVSVIDGPERRDAVVALASTRLVEAVDAIARGEFPPRPAEWRLCGTCAWASVCRKDYVDVE